MTAGIAGLLREKSRPPGIAPLPAATVDQVLSLTGAPPPGEATHWTVRAMAKAVGISRASVQRIWQAHGLQPHRLKAFKRRCQSNANRSPKRGKQRSQAAS